MFYAYCGTNYEDAVAIDNIRCQTTTPKPTTPEPTTPEPTTPEPTTPETTTPEPTTLEPRYCQDYSPCSCSLDSIDSNNKLIYCNSVSVQTVRDVFQRVNDPEIFTLGWAEPLPDGETNTISLPPDFLGNTRVTSYIYIENSYPNCPNLVIDPLAFRSSQNSLTGFYLSFLDFGLQKDFSFLNGFEKLEELSIYSLHNLTAFQYLPPLPSLQTLSVRSCPSELNQIPFPDLSPEKLKYLELDSSEISDEKADEIVAKLAASTSADSLEALYLYGNSLTRIPSQVGSAFPKLKTVFLNHNNISHIPSFSLTFVSRYLEELSLSENGIKTIEIGAFRGKSTS